MINKQKRIRIILCLLMFLLCGCERKEEVVMSFSEDITDEETGVEAEVYGDNMQMSVETVPEEVAVTQEPAFVYVHICGAVVKPGVYQIAQDSRIYEVIELAGGFLQDACTEYWNQAQQVEDGMQIVIPTLQEVERGVVSADGAEAMHFGEQNVAEVVLININTASKEVLCTLPGIGEARAESIIRYRNEHGAFRTIEEIMQVEGIKEKAYLKIKDSITVK